MMPPPRRTPLSAETQYCCSFGKERNKWARWGKKKKNKSKHENDVVFLSAGMTLENLGTNAKNDMKKKRKKPNTLLISEQKTLLPASGSMKNLLLNMASEPVKSMRALVLAYSQSTRQMSGAEQGTATQSKAKKSRAKRSKARQGKVSTNWRCGFK